MIRFLLFCLVALAACSSQPPKPPAPAWISGPTRTFDNGYLVYVGTGSDPDPNTARFKAEGAALQDLANECSFAPKGARVEDHYALDGQSPAIAYAKVGLTFEECEAAKNAVQPEDVRKLANPPLAELIHRYQEMIGAPTQPSAVAQNAPGLPPSETADEAQYYANRQTIFLAKQQVILSPVEFYAVSAPARAQYLTVVEPTVVHVRVYEAAHPTFRAAPHGWSHYSDHFSHPLTAPRQFAPARAGGYHAAPRRGPRRRRRWH